MKRIYPIMIFGLLALPLTAFAEGGDPPTPKCVNEVFEDPEEDSLSDAAASERPLHEAGAKLAKNFICQGGDKCLRKHGDRLTEAAHTIVDVCLADPEVPKWVCLGFVASIANESGGLEHPTCGGLATDCVLQCDKEWDNGKRHDCFKACAIDQGIARGSDRWNRVVKCNDKGTSRGPFQMKKSRIGWCRKKLGKDFDPFDLAQATTCHIEAVKAARGRLGPCGKVDNRWLVAMKRVGKGVLRTVEKAQPGRWVPNPKGKSVWVPPSKPVYEQICSESGYGLRGLRYYRACGKSCQQVTRRAAPVPPVAKDRTLTSTR